MNDLGGRGRAQLTPRQIGHPAERVSEGGIARHRQRHRVHREVTALEIVHQVVAELHLGISGDPVS